MLKHVPPEDDKALSLVASSYSLANGKNLHLSISLGLRICASTYKQKRPQRKVNSNKEINTAEALLIQICLTIVTSYIG